MGKRTKPQINMKRTIRIILYLCGLMLLAVGLTLNTKTTLGVSPLICVAYSATLIWGWDLGNTVFAWYTVFVLIEMLLHRQMNRSNKRQQLVNDLLQLPLSLVFSRLMSLFGRWIPVFETAYEGSFPGSFPGRILILIIAVMITGAGAALTLDMRLIPNPGDGVVQSISDFTGWKLGNAKNLFDLSCVLLTAVMSLLASGKILGIGIGTVIAMLGTGRVIAFVHGHTYPYLKSFVS